VAEISKLQTKAERQLKTIYEKLTPWQKVQVARHPNRPHFGEVANYLLNDFVALAGDRSFSEDKAINGGLARFRDYSVMVIGTEKGNTTQQRLETNFGMAKPEGYRKAKRFMEIADRFNLPIITFIDTAGAYPGIGAEERGQAEAIAKSIEMSLKVNVPTIAVVLGEGGSGGAVALATTDRVLMLEHSIYSVISPEGCASILWRSSKNATEAANALRLTAQDLYSLGIIDEIVKEPLGAAHRDHKSTLNNLGDAIESNLKELSNIQKSSLCESRRSKFVKMTHNKLI
jgi:acetyl-CoA carboxylase carboxyl transferase subunit alpha